MKIVGGFIFNVAVEATRIYATATIAAWLITENRNRYKKEEGIVRAVFDAQSLNLSHLNPTPVSYEPKNIYTEGIEVNPENIGKLSLEFEEELFYDVDGRPFFVFSAKRFDKNDTDGQKAPHELYVRLTDWIVPLWDELHVFRSAVFHNTFTFDFNQGGLHAAPALARPYVEYRQDGVNLHGPMTDVKVLPNADSFMPNDRVRIRDTHDYGTVTVLDVDMGGGLFGIDVKLDNQEYRTFPESDLELYDRKYDANAGEISGPSGTSVMPRVQD